MLFCFPPDRTVVQVLYIYLLFLFCVVLFSCSLLFVTRFACCCFAGLCVGHILCPAASVRFVCFPRFLFCCSAVLAFFFTSSRQSPLVVYFGGVHVFMRVRTVCMCVCAYVHLYVHVFMCMCLCARVYVHVCMRVCVSACMCMHVYVHACVFA